MCLQWTYHLFELLSSLLINFFYLSTSSRIGPLRFQAEDRRRRPNPWLQFFVFIMCLFYCVRFSSFFQYLTKRLAGKNVSGMNFLCLVILVGHKTSTQSIQNICVEKLCYKFDFQKETLQQEILQNTLRTENLSRISRIFLTVKETCWNLSRIVVRHNLIFKNFIVIV